MDIKYFFDSLRCEITRAEDAKQVESSVHIRTDQGLERMRAEIVFISSSHTWLATAEIELGLRFYEHFSHDPHPLLALDKLQEHAQYWLETGKYKN